ncbi:MAG: methylenetetrahydrofolate--tRNA-(uracil(54)-C(5))-methyltransferase (FADH(2)-oxidizing) TrmFO [Clostridia bacterium]|nr:methylenetetrahydrofolate--tRNA-(uracil(54)-C(5))-methyltransferase (FADH(2)-oxidizing) TrmFO [Clostridia bacterium]
MAHINVFGAGLAGSEAAWQAAQRGVEVTLYEMKPHKYTPAHHSEGYAELVCSNSLRSDRVTVASGLLKEELARMGSLIMEAARATQVPAGSALAVDREKFSAYITEKIQNHPLITVVEEEITELPTEGITVVATGPLTSDTFADWLKDNLIGEGFHFFDAVAPIVDFASINMEVAFFASRYNKGDADYINCPMTKEQYDAFYNALITAEEAELKDFDKDLKVFEGCMPVEVMAKRGYDTLRYGPLKPVGLVDSRTDARSYAVVQLRRENREGTMYNLVGFQTHLTFPAQKRVFSMIPGLENADFLRYGVMHRNTYLPSPDLLDADYKLRKGYGEGQVYFAGQMTGVEGYIESTGSGFVAGLNAARLALGLEPLIFPQTTMIGAMAHYISHGGLGDFVPMNANFGIIPSLETRVKGGKVARYEVYAARALEALDGVMDTVNQAKQ